MIKESKERVMVVAQARWNELPPKLQAREPHSPHNLHKALIRTHLYKETLEKMKARVEWKKLYSPSLLVLSDKRGIYEKEKKKRWKEEE